ncbi:armadillo repeat-containing protein 10-like [Ptychodera flava]|uniref:armadillo repeat-containing protein 10-like n=1 Tax=Ptychodera flava TaxID=63121 RepID=UPI00396A1D23
MAASARLAAVCASVIIFGFAGFAYYLFSSKNRKLKIETNQSSQDNDDKQEKERSKLAPASPQKTLKRVPSVVGLLSSEEAVVLVGMLATQDNEQLKRVLTTIANGAAFTTNQDLIRDAGGLPLLLFLLESKSKDVQESAANALSNVAVNHKNQIALQDLQCSTVVVKQLNQGENSDSLQLSLLRLLTNLSVSTEWHESLLPALPRLIKYLNPDVRKDLQLQSLKALVNFSCNPDLFMQIITLKVDKSGIIQLLSSEDIDILLRLLTFLSNLATTKNMRKISRKQFLQEGSKESTFGSVMYGKNTEELLSELTYLKSHRDAEISNLAAKVSVNLT